MQRLLASYTSLQNATDEFNQHCINANALYVHFLTKGIAHSSKPINTAMFVLKTGNCRYKWY